MIGFTLDRSGRATASVSHASRVVSHTLLIRGFGENTSFARTVRRASDAGAGRGRFRRTRVPHESEHHTL